MWLVSDRASCTAQRKPVSGLTSRKRAYRQTRKRFVSSDRGMSKRESGAGQLVNKGTALTVTRNLHGDVIICGAACQVRNMAKKMRKSGLSLVLKSTSELDFPGFQWVASRNGWCIYVNRVAAQKCPRPVNGQICGTALVVQLVDTRGRTWLPFVQRRYDGGLLACPGGMVEPGETPAAAAARELLEETGLVAPVDNLACFALYYRPYLLHGETWGNATHVFCWNGVLPCAGSRRYSEFSRKSPAEGEVERVFYVPKNRLLDQSKPAPVIARHLLMLKAFFETHAESVSPENNASSSGADRKSVFYF